MTSEPPPQETGRRRRRVTERGGGSVHPRPGGQPQLPFPPLEPVSRDELESIHQAALKVLKEIGIDFLHDEARAMLNFLIVRPGRTAMERVSIRTTSPGFSKATSLGLHTGVGALLRGGSRADLAQQRGYGGHASALDELAQDPSDRGVAGRKAPFAHDRVDLALAPHREVEPQALDLSR